MLISKNPKGETECYTDIGQYIGTLPPDFPISDYIQDGGPGSGNFGHRGRPGKVGGSGKGGGKQYRGGRADIGYFGSRKDWLNGLKGEEQAEASKMVSEGRRNLDHLLRARERIEKMHKDGRISEEEMNKALESGGLKDFNKNSTPEEYIMRKGVGTERVDLLAALKQARSWDETKDRLIDDNLSEDEQKIYRAMLNPNGWGKDLSNEDALKANRIKDMLEAKAMGAFESDIEVPDEIQYSLGTKERPAPPEPKKPENPTNPDDIDYSWLDKPSFSWYGRNFDDRINWAMGPDRIPSYNLTNDEIKTLNRKFVDKLKYGEFGIVEVRDYALRGVIGLRRRWAEAMTGKEDGFDFQKGLSRLSADEQKELLSVMGEFNPDVIGKDIKDLTEDDFIKTENTMMRHPLRKKAERAMVQKYMLAQEKMILGIEPTSEESKASAAEAAKKAEQEAYQKKVDAWHKKHSPEEIKKMYKPDSVSGVKRGKDMSRDEADRISANPYRSSHDSQEKGNCQTCVVAYEMRRRGYDVIAKPRYGDAETEQRKLAKHEGCAWIDPDTGERVPNIVPDKRLTPKSAAKWLDSVVKEGQRYTMSVCWNDCWGAHIMNVEKENGELRIVDAQVGRQEVGLEAIEKYMSRVHLNSTSGGNWRPTLNRVDNALCLPEYYDKILLPG